MWSTLSGVLCSVLPLCFISRSFLLLLPFLPLPPSPPLLLGYSKATKSTCFIVVQLGRWEWDTLKLLPSMSSSSSRAYCPLPVPADKEAVCCSAELCSSLQALRWDPVEEGFACLDALALIGGQRTNLWILCISSWWARPQTFLPMSRNLALCFPSKLRWKQNFSMVNLH